MWYLAQIQLQEKAQIQLQIESNSTPRKKRALSNTPPLGHITDGDQGLRFNGQTLKPLIAQGWGSRWILFLRG